MLTFIGELGGDKGKGVDCVDLALTTFFGVTGNSGSGTVPVWASASSTASRLATLGLGSLGGRPGGA